MTTNPLHSIVPHISAYSDSPGLSKREYFAAMAMLAIVSDPGGNTPESIAKWAVKYTDALIKELNREQE